MLASREGCLMPTHKALIIYFEYERPCYLTPATSDMRTVATASLPYRGELHALHVVSHLRGFNLQSGKTITLDVDRLVGLD
jgi:hypothetical protein